MPITSPLSFGKLGVSVFVDWGTAYDKGQRLGDQTMGSGRGRRGLAHVHGLPAERGRGPRQGLRHARQLRWRPHLLERSRGSESPRILKVRPSDLWTLGPSDLVISSCLRLRHWSPVMNVRRLVLALALVASGVTVAGAGHASATSAIRRRDRRQAPGGHGRPGKAEGHPDDEAGRESDHAGPGSHHDDVLQAAEPVAPGSEGGRENGDQRVRRHHALDHQSADRIQPPGRRVGPAGRHVSGTRRPSTVRSWTTSRGARPSTTWPGSRSAMGRRTTSA